MFRYSKFTTTILIIFIALISINLLWTSGEGFQFGNTEYSRIIFQIRVPRVLTVIFAGGCVSIAGLLSQALFRNALATPSVIGTEAGASLGLALCVALIEKSTGELATTDLVMVSSFAGAFIATFMTLVLGRKSNSLIKILLGGFALNAFLGAASALITSWLMESGRGVELYHWLLGSFSARNWGHVALIAIAAIICFIASLNVSHSLDLLSLGEDAAASMGVSIAKLNRNILVLIAILVGTSIAVGGALPFVGLIVPHFTRLKTGPYIRPLLLNTFCVGSSLTLIADFAARNIRYPVEMNVGVLTTLIGAPYFIYLLKSQANYD